MYLLELHFVNKTTHIKLNDNISWYVGIKNILNYDLYFLYTTDYIQPHKIVQNPCDIKNLRVIKS